MKAILLSLLAFSALAFGTPEEADPESDIFPAVVKVIANREDGLVVRKVLMDYKMVRDPVSGKVFRQFAGTKLGDTMYFIHHTKATRKAPLNARFHLKGRQSGSHRLNDISVMAVIVPVSIGEIVPPKE